MQTVVAVCGDMSPDQACDGPIGPMQVYVGDLTANAWVLYEAGMVGGPCPVGVYNAGGPFGPVNQLPQGGCIWTEDSMTKAQLYASASTLTFGAGAAYTPPFDVSQLDATNMAEAFATCFVLVGVAFATGKGIAVLLRFFFV